MLIASRTSYLSMALAAAGYLSFGTTPVKAQHGHGHSHGHSHDHGHGHIHGHIHDHGHIHGHIHVAPPYTSSYVVPAPVVNVVPAPVVNVVPYQGVGLVVTNPIANGTALNFDLDGQAYTLMPGQQIKPTHLAAPNIVFSKGGTMGQANYQLRDGKSYYFEVSTTGWDLKEATVAVARTNPVPLEINPAVFKPIPSVSNDDAPPAVAKPVQFDPLIKGDTILVSSQSAEVRNGSEVLATVPAGKALKVLDMRGDWVMVDAGGQSVYGWLHRRNVRKADLSGEEAPAAVKKIPG